MHRGLAMYHFKSFSRCAALILMIAACCNTASAQNNLNCYNPTMPPMDVIAACDQVINNDASDAQAHQARGAAYFKMGDYDRAIADFSRSINIDPKYIKAFYNRGLAWEKKGNLDSALTDFRYFVDVDTTGF